MGEWVSGGPVPPVRESPATASLNDERRAMYPRDITLEKFPITDVIYQFVQVVFCSPPGRHIGSHGPVYNFI